MKPNAVTMLASLCVVGVACTPQGEGPADARSRTAPPTMKMTTDIPASVTIPDEVETRLGTLRDDDFKKKLEKTRADLKADYEQRSQRLKQSGHLVSEAFS